MSPKRRVLAEFPGARCVELGYRKFNVQLWPDGASIARADKRSTAWTIAAEAVAAGMAEAREKGLAWTTNS